VTAPRQPLARETRAAALHVLRRQLWTSPLEHAVARDALARGAATPKQARLLGAVGARLARAEAETPLRPACARRAGQAPHRAPKDQTNEATQA
jgi:hypothetical protein